jgi:hypothetical protein
MSALGAPRIGSMIATPTVAGRLHALISLKAEKALTA